MVTEQPMIVLNDGNRMPQLGFGVWKVPADDTARAVGAAIAAGYRSVDTAAIYGNEAGVGAAIADSGLPRADLFITTKLWNTNHGHDATLRAFDDSMARLGLDRLDLYLIHWPVPGQDRFVETWRALIRLRDEGWVRSIGVSNFLVPHLQRLIDETGVAPAVNQIELHPRFQQAALRAFHARHGIATESWSPLGRGTAFADPVVAAIAARHGRTAAQVIIRWHLDLGLIVIPKSVTPARIRENIAVFDFTLDDADRAALARLDRADGRTGPDPLTFA